MPGDPPRPRRERSVRYPGAALGECVEFVRMIDQRGLGGLSAAGIAAGLGYSNAKTNTFSARLSASRQFGLLELNDEGYGLTPLARSILHPVEPSELPRLYRQALLAPPLYSDLASRLADRRVPEASVLANILYHHHQITASAKEPAAESFLESARFAGALSDDGIFRPDGRESVATGSATPPRTSPTPAATTPRPKGADVRLDLRLWGPDVGKVIRLRAPEAITRASFERFLSAFRLLVRIDESDEMNQT